MAGMFCDMHPKKKAQLEEAMKDENWEDYTTYAHALKSTALSLGGKRLSEAAKKAEEAGKRFLAGDAKEQEKAIAELREGHEKLMCLYDELAGSLREETAAF